MSVVRIAIWSLKQCTVSKHCNECKVYLLALQISLLHFTLCQIHQNYETYEHMELQKYLLAQVGSLIGLQYVLPPDLPPHSALKCKVVGGRVVGNVE